MSRSPNVPRTIQLQWSSADETIAWVGSFIHVLQRPCVILLNGEMGVGKTQLVKWFVQQLGISSGVSPTFAIHQQYHGVNGIVDHVDLYRLQSDSDLESSGFWDLFTSSDGLVFVEWADRLPSSVWPETWKKIRIDLKFLNQTQRQASIEIQ